jgi:hypothetical protein
MSVRQFQANERLASASTECSSCRAMFFIFAIFVPFVAESFMSLVA